MHPRLANLLPILAGVTVGLAAGLAAYTFVYAKGYSYLLDDPAACANCHVMNPQMDGWVKSSHHAVATSGDGLARPGVDAGVGVGVAECLPSVL